MLLRKARRLAVCVIVGVTASLLPPPSPAAAAVDTMTINMAVYGGAPTYRASGFIYGVSDDTASPSVSLTDQIKVKNMRGGGSQLGCPNGGWVNGQYDRRWNWVRDYYRRGQRTDARVEMIVAGLWGSDGICTVPRWPGDNDNIPSWLQANGSVNVRIERMPATNAYVSAPTVVSTSRFAVSGGRITVPINWTNRLDAYTITLTP